MTVWWPRIRNTLVGLWMVAVLLALNSINRHASVIRAELNATSGIVASMYFKGAR